MDRHRKEAEWIDNLTNGYCTGAYSLANVPPRPESRQVSHGSDCKDRRSSDTCVVYEASSLATLAQTFQRASATQDKREADAAYQKADPRHHRCLPSLKIPKQCDCIIRCPATTTTLQCTGHQFLPSTRHTTTPTTMRHGQVTLHPTRITVRFPSICRRHFRTVGQTWRFTHKRCTMATTRNTKRRQQQVSWSFTTIRSLKKRVLRITLWTRTASIDGR